MAQPILHHRTPEFSRLLAEVQDGLRRLFQTEQEVLVLASSGTGAMEAAVTNTLSAGDKVIVVNGGKFGERWVKICQAFAVQVVEIRVEWGKAVEGHTVAQVLSEHPDARALLVQASETSTTVLHPVEEIAALTRERDLLLMVDGITAVGAMDIPMDRWGIDILVTGSQKALMLPPGLAFTALSPKAWQFVEKAGLPRFYFDLARERKEQRKHTTAYTPAISLIVGLHEVLQGLEQEGLSRVFARHALLAQATRAAVQALGLSLLAPDNPSPAATGVWLPQNIGGTRFLSYLRDFFGVDFAGGQDQLRGRVVRIAHIGYVGPFDIITAISALEMALEQFDHPVELGRGVAVVERILAGEWPRPQPF
jgi:aspartate aminotransferase-like enzyme